MIHCYLYGRCLGGSSPEGQAIVIKTLRPRPF